LNRVAGDAGTEAALVAVATVTVATVAGLAEVGMSHRSLARGAKVDRGGDTSSSAPSSWHCSWRWACSVGW
jgi:hypothetical protein